MRTIKFMVNGQHIECTETISDLVGNTREYVQAQFTLSSEWDGLIQIAVFTANGKSYPELIDNGVCIVPYKVMMQESFTVGCYAGATTDRITTDICTVRVEKSVRYQGGSDYVDLYQRMKEKVDESERQIDAYKAAVQETMYEHCQHKTHTPDGAHDLRIHDGVFQYYDGGWKDTKVKTGDAQETYSWLNLALLRFIGQYDYDDTKDVLLSSFKLEEKGQTVSESTLDIFQVGYSKVIYARSGNRMYEWKVYADSSVEGGVKITSLYKASGDERLTLVLKKLKGAPLLVFENTTENGDSVEVAIICFVEILPNPETRLNILEAKIAAAESNLLVLTKANERLLSDMWCELIVSDNREKRVMQKVNGTIPNNETVVVVAWSEKQQVPFHSEYPFYIIAQAGEDIFVEKCKSEYFGPEGLVRETVYQTNNAKTYMEMTVARTGVSIPNEEISIKNKSGVEVKTTVLAFM